MADFAFALDKVLRHEGQYSCDANDPGGATAWGITEAEARGLGYTGDMKVMPVEVAAGRYRAAYWNPLKGDEQPDQAIAEEMFDSGVNIGITRVIQYLQRVLNLLSERERYWPLLAVDGVMGHGTLMTLIRCLELHPKHRLVILRVLDSLQCVRYVDLAEHNPKFEDFLTGWILNRCGTA